MSAKSETDLWILLVMMSKLQHCFNALLSTTFYDFHFLF